MNDLIYLVPLFPLIGFLINGLFRKPLSKSAISVIGSGVILLSFIVSIILFFDIKEHACLFKYRPGRIYAVCINEPE